MLIKYLGPSKFARVVPYGEHHKDDIRDYPDDFAHELLATSKKQQFIPAEEDSVIATTPPLGNMKVHELRGLAEKLEIDVDPKAKKTDLIDAIEAATAEPPEKD